MSNGTRSGLEVVRSWVQWVMARSKNSLTHLLANVVIAMSAAIEVVMFVMSYVDDETRNAIVGVVGEHNVHIASTVSVVLMLLTKMARDRNANPFNTQEPH